MPRSFKHLWPRIVDWDALINAWRCCRRRKRFKPDAVRFEMHRDENLIQLRRELMTDTYRPGPYRHFFIHDPKKRRISAAPFRDRIVHHAIVNVLQPVFESRFVFDSYACRPGKGTHRARDRANGFLRRFDFYLQTDIVRFFPSVDHECLLDVLRRNVADDRLIQLVELILASGRGIHDDTEPVWFPGDDLLSPLRPTGLPIGNLTSQFLANVFLNPVDHFIKEELRVPAYVRYADDLVLFGNDRRVLRNWHAALVARLARLRLRLHKNKTQIRASHSGLPFLGFRLSRTGRPRVLQPAIRRFSRRLRQQKRQFAAGEISLRDIAASLQAWQAHTRLANCKGLQRDLWKRVLFSRPVDWPKH